MQKKISLLCMGMLSICLCACQRNVSEPESALQKTEQSVEQGDKWEEAYQNLLLEEDVERTALIYLDEDTTPELLVLQNGEYRLYTFDGSQITAINMPDAGIKAEAYVPYQGLIRVHGGDGERCDYYLRYENGSLELELKAKFTDYIWHTYNAQQEIANEEFLSSLSERGYDQLMPCGFLYDNIEDAYENIGKTSNSREVLDDFANGKIDALYQVEKITDISEIVSFWM